MTASQRPTDNTAPPRPFQQLPMTVGNFNPAQVGNAKTRILWFSPLGIQRTDSVLLSHGIFSRFAGADFAWVLRGKEKRGCAAFRRMICVLPEGGSMSASKVLAL